MKPENPDEMLLEQGLAAWDVPDPPPGLADRILAQNAETLTALSNPPGPNLSPPEPPTLEEERTPMQPTSLRPESSMRPFWTATAMGFAAAAAIVLAFMAGRQSTPAAPATAVVPNVEVQVTAPAPVAQPPAPPAPQIPPSVPADSEDVRVPQNNALSDRVPRPPKPPKVGRSKDLKNPFRDDEVQPRTPDDRDNRTLKDPFSSEKATLRLGTNAGSPPAQVTVDGKPVGMTPISSLKVAPGEHTVVFRWPDMRRSMTIDVEANESKIVKAGHE